MELKANIPSGPIEQKWTRHKFEMKLVSPANKRKFSVIIVGSGLAGGSFVIVGVSLVMSTTFGRIGCAG